MTQPQDAERCSICLQEGTLEDPLHRYCRCNKGDASITHNACMLDWLVHSRTHSCRFCAEPYDLVHSGVQWRPLAGRIWKLLRYMGGFVWDVAWFGFGVGERALVMWMVSILLKISLDASADRIAPLVGLDLRNGRCLRAYARILCLSLVLLLVFVPLYYVAYRWLYLLIPRWLTYARVASALVLFLAYAKFREISKSPGWLSYHIVRLNLPKCKSV